MISQINKVHQSIKEIILKLKEDSISKKRLEILNKILNETNIENIIKTLNNI